MDLSAERASGGPASSPSVTAVSPSDATAANGQFSQPSRWRALQRTLAQIVAQPKGLIGLSLIVFYALLAVLGPWIAPQDPYTQSFVQTLRSPSFAHWFGTDQLGRDIFSRVLTGAGTSIGIGVGGVAIAFVIGVPLGIVAAFRGGWLDSVIMRCVDVMLSFPDIIFALAVVALLGADTQNVIIAAGLVSVPVYTRTARAVTLSTLAEPYIEGSRTLGCGPLRIVFRHILPNIGGMLLTLSSLLFASTLLTASGLGFLGLGVQPPAPEWGAMLGDSRSYISSQPYMATFPGLFLGFAALAFNLLGEALRTIYDPAAAHTKRASGFAMLWKRLRVSAKKGPDQQARHLKKHATPAEAMRGDAVPSTLDTLPVLPVLPVLPSRTPPDPSAQQTPQPTAILARGVEIAYLTAKGPLAAVRGVDLAVVAGRTTAIVGESGSGKSTFLRALATLLPIGKAAVTGGQIFIGGTDVASLKRRALCDIRRTEIGFVFQDPSSALNPVTTIGAQLAEAIAYGTSLSKKAIYDRSIKLLGEMGITMPEKRLTMYPHQFSGGMKQRIVIAMAIAQDPKVLLADEPTSALDVTVQKQILTLLRERQRATGLAIVLVTHDLRLVKQYADDVAVMYAGKFVEQGPVERVFSQPQHPYTRALKQSTPEIGEQQAQPVADRDDGQQTVPLVVSSEPVSRYLHAIGGEPPMLGTLPAGCAFEPRCTLCHEREDCRSRTPMLRQIADQTVACHHAEEWS